MIGTRTPAACYVVSPRSMPDRLPPLEYPDRFEVRYVNGNGGIRWNARPTVHSCQNRLGASECTRRSLETEHRNQATEADVLGNHHAELNDLRISKLDA
jgi:hypothetical protein